jgi:hypothetical protein
VTEREFTDAVLDLGHVCGWLCMHQRPLRLSNGHWRTATTGNGALGWPDLVLCRPPRLVFAELKVGRNKPSDDQAVWLELLERSGAEAYLWRDSDMARIIEVLR